MRIGLGRDVHRLVAGRRLTLGGVAVPFDKGEAGHSDGDALVHALIDALLGAAGLGDIGEWFPPGDARWKDADSMGLLERVWGAVRGEGWRLVNVDCVVSCEAPRLLPYRQMMRERLAGALGVDAERVFVKAKTGEGLGDVGEGRAVEALAVCLLQRHGA
ncbi:MAG: 2-C-methyl-D-erythritol 2,4-cyclodiphosphate synthase [Spirochaetaceae bacterium]|nr:2-C-methyl-D-erythritol 2,4-cyclodiphosphate synthase [Spirochaetaceae bacterium]